MSKLIVHRVYNGFKRLLPDANIIMTDNNIIIVHGEYIYHAIYDNDHGTFKLHHPINSLLRMRPTSLIEHIIGELFTNKAI